MPREQEAADYAREAETTLASLPPAPTILITSIAFGVARDVGMLVRPALACSSDSHTRRQQPTTGGRMKKTHVILSEQLRQDYLARQAAEGRDFTFKPLETRSQRDVVREEKGGRRKTTKRRAG